MRKKDDLVVGNVIKRYRVLSSTNDFLKARHGEFPTGIVVVAAEQTRGRGRFSRKWHSPAGGLWFSVLFRNTVPSKSFLLAFAAAVSVTQAMRGLGVHAAIKWPNDVYVGKRKVCGILPESVVSGRLQDVVVGIGINVNNRCPLPSAITMRMCLGKRIDVDGFMGSVLVHYNRYYSMLLGGKSGMIIRDWNKCWGWRGRRVCLVAVNRTVRGVAEGISKDGSLVIRTAGGKKVFVIEGDYC